MRFNFVEIHKGHGGRGHTQGNIPYARLSPKYGRIYLSAGFLKLLPHKFTMARLFWDREAKVIGIQFNSAANNVPDNYKILRTRNSALTSSSYHISSKHLFMEIGGTIKDIPARKLVFIPELNEESPERDFFIIHLTKEV